VSGPLEDRAAHLLALVDPLRRAAAREMQVVRRTWEQESRARVADVLGCSVGDLASLDGAVRLGTRTIDDATPRDELVLKDTSVITVQLPLGDVKSQGAFDWVVITRHRYPATPAHEWGLERHRLETDEQRPNWTSGMWGWYWSHLTAEGIAIACDQYAIDAHYMVAPGGRLRWQQAGVDHRTAPDGSAAVEAQVQTLVRIQKQNATAFRLQVRLEDWREPNGDKIRRWGYRVLDPAGDVVRDESSSSHPAKYEYGYATRSEAIQAGRTALREVLRDNGWDSYNWEDVH